MPYFCHACSTHFTALPAGATENAPYCPDCQSEFVEVVAGSDNDAATNYADFAFDESEDDGVIDDAFGGGVGGRAMPPPQGLGLLDLVGLLARTGAENRPELGTVGAASTAGGSASGRAIGGTTGVGITSPQVRAQTFGFSISSANGGRPVFYGSMVDEDHPIVTMPPPPPFGMTTSLRDRILAEREQRRGPTVVDLDDAGELPGSIVNRGDDASESTSASAAGLNSEERRARTQQHHQRRQEVNLILEALLQASMMSRQSGFINEVPQGGAAGNPLFRLFGGVGDPRDYVFGQTGLDDVVTQMMNQMGQGQGHPHLTDEQITLLKRVRVRGQDLGEHPECPVCQDDFSNEEGGEETIILECKHHFHPQCIENWLKLNATCPVCRKQVAPPDSATGSGSG